MFNFKLVRGDVQCLHEIEAEICRWEDILRIEYVRYMRGDTELYSSIDLHITGEL